MPFELDIQKSVIVLTKIRSRQYHGMLIVELVIKCELNPFQCDTDILSPLEHIDGFCDIGSDIISVHNFADFILHFFLSLFPLISLLTIFLILHFLKHVLIHASNKHRFKILAVLSLWMIFRAVICSHFLF